MTVGSERPVLVIGGAGFIGANLAAHFARAGHHVRIYDDLSRPGVDQNLAWLQRNHGDRIDARIASVCDRAKLRDAIDGAQVVFHLAAQVAVSASLVDPRTDFEVNTCGTIEVLEALRVLAKRPPLVFASTTKVYGCLPELPMQIDGNRWHPADSTLLARGIDERRPLEFRTPHGCSKGAADQYVLEYAESFGLDAAVVRLGCVYGPRQLGTEEQGWVAQFLTRALADEAITISGDGRQVRDVLFVDDLVEAFAQAWRRISALRARAFNLGGGPRNTVSLLELLDMIGQLRGRRPDVAFEDWRAGDQRYDVSDTSAFTALTGWRPRVGVRVGIEALHGWLVEQRRAGAAHA